MSAESIEVAVLHVHARVRFGALAVAGVGALVLMIAALVDPARALIGYLSLFCSATFLAVGALVLLQIVHAMDAAWPVAVRRAIEAPVHALPAIATLFVPIVVLAPAIYPWLAPESLSEHAREVVADKGSYMTVAGFAIRGALVWTTWLVVAGLLLRRSRAQDDHADPALRVAQRRLSAGALPLVALALTLAAFDWIMSLEPTWTSSVFGIEVFAGGFVAAIATVTILVAQADRARLLRGLVSASHYYALGRLLFAFIVFWGYIEFFQALILWIGNVPHEIEWYLHRLHNGWQLVAVAIGLGHFVVPFAVLLSYRIKRHRGPLAAIAVWLLVFHVLQVHWTIVPAHPGAPIVHWGDLGALLLVGGTCVAWVAWRLDGRPVAPRLDPALARGARYHSV